MKQTNSETIAQMRDHVAQHPESNYNQIAATFDVSVATVKRYCKGMGRSKERTGRTSGSADPQRFWLKVNRKEADECWLWTGSLNNSGYGFVSWDGENKAAHRLAYELLTKELIQGGLEIDHLCRNRLCCNPAHLEPATHRENLERRPRPIPNTNSPSIDTQPQNIDTDTDLFTPSKYVQESVPQYVHDANSESENIETNAPSGSVSIQQSQPQVMPPEVKRRTPVIAARPTKADPFAPICLMQAPPEI
jgi:hypothetical protein